MKTMIRLAILSSIGLLGACSSDGSGCGGPSTFCGSGTSWSADSNMCEASSDSSSTNSD